MKPQAISPVTTQHAGRTKQEIHVEYPDPSLTADGLFFTHPFSGDDTETFFSVFSHQDKTVDGASVTVLYVAVVCPRRQCCPVYWPPLVRLNDSLMHSQQQHSTAQHRSAPLYGKITVSFLPLLLLWKKKLGSSVHPSDSLRGRGAFWQLDPNRSAGRFERAEAVANCMGSKAVLESSDQASWHVCFLFHSWI